MIIDMLVFDQLIQGILDEQLRNHFLNERNLTPHIVMAKVQRQEEDKLSNAVVVDRRYNVLFITAQFHHQIVLLKLEEFLLTA